MIAITLAALIASTPGQTAMSPTPTPDTESPVRLEDVEVTGRPLDSMIRNFINEVAAPNPDRGLARWSGNLCVGAANLSNDAAQYLVDRVSTVADDLGLRAGSPGCVPNILIVATDEPTALAQDMVDLSRRTFRMGGAGMDRGGAALQRFVQSNSPVRWWQVSLPVDSSTGKRAVRLPGDGEDNGANGSVLNYAPHVPGFAASRLTTQIQDNLVRTIIVVDVTKLEGVSIDQLADYIAMVSLAQIDPQADTSAYASILNVFAEPDGAPWLTDWDRAYLTGLYDAERSRKNLRAGKSEIASSISQAHAQLRIDQPD